MSDYIKREDAYIAIHEQYPHLNDAGVHLVINVIPAADVVERKKGEWIEDDDGYQICSECGAEHHWCDYRASFCEDCGADMRKDGDT